MHSKVVILGAGVSGLSLAWKLAEKGISVDILESSPKVGGLCKTHDEGNDCHLDYGPHSFFTEDSEVLNVFHDLLSYPIPALKRKVKFYYKNKYLDYPLTPLNVLFQMGMGSGLCAAGSYLKGRIFRNSPKFDNEDEQSVEDWAIANFGNHLYKHFFKPYTEQFWRMPCSKLSARSIPTHTRTSFANTLKLLVQKKVTQKGSTMVEREKLPTFYPEKGYGELPTAIAQRATEAGCRILLNSRVEKVKVAEDGQAVISYWTTDGIQEMTSSHVVSTIPLPVLLRILEVRESDELKEAAKNLDFRPLLVLGLVTKKQNILGDAMYAYQMSRPYNRLYEANKFSEKTSPEGMNILGCELACGPDEEIWNATEEELFELCIESLSKDGTLHREAVEGTLLLRARYAYPIYKKGYKKSLDRVVEILNNYPQLDLLGRSGEFRYMDADHCMRRSFNFSKNFMATHQESLV